MKLLALLFTVATAIGLVVAPSASVVSASAVTADSKPSVVFSVPGSGLVTPGVDFTLSGSITNNSAADLPAATATAYIDRGLVATRADLTEWAGSTGSVAVDKLGSALASVPTPLVQAGRTVAITIQIPAAAVGIATDASWGVRRIAVRVATPTHEVGESRSGIVWNSANTLTPVSLALATPLTVPGSTTGLISSATLAEYTSPTGILTRQLDQAFDRHIALGIDPMVIVSIRILGTSAPATARDWLDRLAATTNEVFPLTYADSDAAGASQAGAAAILAPTSFIIDPRLFPGYTVPPTASPTTSPTPNPSATPNPTLWTTKTITNWTYTPALANLVWPSDDTVTEANLDAFATAGYTSTILSSGNVTYPDLEFTPGAAAVVAKRSAAVSDAQLSELVRAAAAAPDDAHWQKAMADLSAGIAMVVNQRTGGAREFLATLDRSDPGSDSRLAQTMQGISALPWAALGKLADVVGSATSTAATISPKPESATRIATIQRMLASEVRLGSFSSVLADPTVLTGERRLSMLAVLANTWNTQLPAWQTAAGKYLASSAKMLNSVQIARTGSQALLSDTVNLGVSVTNELPWPVTVLVQVASPTGAIRVEKSPISLTIEANSQAKASVPVKALANGDVVLSAALSSATGVAVGPTRSLDVNVQAGWESAITAGFALLVFGVFGLGIYRSIAKRRKREKAGAANDAVADDDTVASE
jgi:hypothetical protein